MSYKPAKIKVKTEMEIDASELYLKTLEFLLVHAGDDAVEVRRGIDGRAYVCVTPDVTVQTFVEVYGADV